jgi:hypothetical protein
MQPAFNTLHFHHAFFDSAVETFRALIVLYAYMKINFVTLHWTVYFFYPTNEMKQWMPTDHKLHVTFSHSSPPWWHSFLSNFLVGYLSSADWTHENKTFTVYFRKTNSSCFFIKNFIIFKSELFLINKKFFV